MNGDVSTGEDSAAFYSDTYCCFGCDMADAVWLFQADASFIGRHFNWSDGLDMQTHAHIGR